MEALLPHLLWCQHVKPAVCIVTLNDRRPAAISAHMCHSTSIMRPQGSCRLGGLVQRCMHDGPCSSSMTDTAT